MTGHIAIIDGNSVICRAYFGGPKDKIGRDGQDVGAVSTYVEMLWRILGAVELGDITHIAVVFDAGGGNHRYELYPQYKANRDEKPSGLLDQFALCQAITEKLTLKSLRVPGYEGDDVISTLAWNAKQQGMQVSIISVDKDFLQIVDDDITIFDPRSDQWRHICREDVIAEKGVPPEQIVDLMAICGDTADNIPGVKGIGAKTAAALLQEFGSLNGIYDHIESTPEKRGVRLKLEADRENAFLSKQLVTLLCDVPLPYSCYGEFEIANVKPGREVLDFLDNLGLPTLREKIARRIGYLEAAA